MEYIEREAAKDAVCKAFVRWGSEDQYHESTHQIDRIPAADVVEVVRCGECKHYDNGWCHRVHNPAQYSKTTDDWFCADGERKDGDGE